MTTTPYAVPLPLTELAAQARARARWKVWCSPVDQPAWSRPALLAIAGIAAFLYAWNIAGSGYAFFYSTAVKSMSVSWKAFFYGALDPGATITLDKLAGSFLPQALSARIFGFHAWSLTLPQVVEGVISVLVIHRIVRRWAGPVPATLAAALFAFTPVLVSMFGHPMEDGALTVCLVLAADSYQHAVLEGRVRSLMLAALWVGLGFQAKMMQAWIVLPAFALGYLFTAPPTLRRRLLHLLLAGVVAAGVSFSWILLYTLTPAKDRPYIDGSTNNSAVSMVFGYNGFGRFGMSVDGAVAGMRRDVPADLRRDTAVGANSAGGANGTNSRFAGQPTGAAKLFSGRLVTQIGWLYPLAFAALAFGLVGWFRRRRRTERLGSGLLMWGVWLVTAMAVFSGINVPHTAYMAALAPPLAALSGFGIVEFWRAYRRDGAAAWLLPAVILVQAGWCVYLARDYTSFAPWLIPAAIVTALFASAALGFRLVTQRAPGRLLSAALVSGVAAMVLMPATWSLSALNPEYDGSAMDATAGPSGRGLTMTQTSTLSAQQTRMLDFVDAHRDGAKYVMATTTWSAAAPYIVATGQKVLPMGGFSGSVPEPTLTQFKRLVESSQLRFVVVGATGRPGFGGGAGRFGFAGSAAANDARTTATTSATRPTSTVGSVTQWVENACATVPAADYGGGRSMRAGAGRLYQCSPSAR